MWVSLLVAASGFAAWPFLDEGTSSGVDASLLLDAEAVLRSDGTEFAFSVRRPSRVKIWVHLPMMLDGTVRVGPAASAGPRDIAYVPRRSDEMRFHAMGRMDEGAPVELTLMAVGPYFIRIEPIPVAMGDADVKVQAIVHAAPIE